MSEEDRKQNVHPWKFTPSGIRYFHSLSELQEFPCRNLKWNKNSREKCKFWMKYQKIMKLAILYKYKCVELHSVETENSKYYFFVLLNIMLFIFFLYITVIFIFSDYYHLSMD